MLEEPSEFSRKEKEMAKDFFAKVVEAMHSQPVLIKETSIQQMQPKIQAEIPKSVMQIRLPPAPPKVVYSEIQEIKFGKILALILDPKIKIIVCEGENKRIIAKEALRLEPRETDIQLNNDEIKGIIQQFSEKAKVPITSVFRAIFANLSIEAISSEIIGSRFIITKL